jgi:hypothetical protein
MYPWKPAPSDGEKSTHDDKDNKGKVNEKDKIRKGSPNHEWNFLSSGYLEAISHKEM